MLQNLVHRQCVLSILSGLIYVSQMERALSVSATSMSWGHDMAGEEDRSSAGGKRLQQQCVRLHMCRQLSQMCNYQIAR